MENKNKPINPIVNQHGFATKEDNVLSDELTGLTKREYFAGLAMQASLSTGKASNAEDWVRNADALLKELEKTK